MKRVFALLIFSILLAGSEGVEGGPPGGRSPAWTGWSIGEVVVRALAAQGDDLWIGTSNGLIRFDRKKESHQVFNTRAGLLSNVIVSIHIGPKGDVWLGTYGGGLTRFDGKRWEHFTPYGRGTRSYGADWIQYAPRNGLGDLWVYDLLFEPNGAMWVATWKGASFLPAPDGGSRGRANGFVTYTMDDGLVDKWVYTIEREAPGVLWFGTEGGINRFDGKNWKGWTHRDGLGADVTEDGGRSSPETSYEGEGGHHRQNQKENQGINPNYVISSAIDAKGIKWFGTWGGGLSRFDGKKFVNYTTADGLAGNIVNAIEIDRRGILWIGSNNGVSRFDGKEFKNFTMRDGLLGNYVYSIAIDPEGNKWFGTFGGVSRYGGE
ncbi:MAG TPA: two-component regulator propeller domain-containing protein [Candidatus Manganitrophaceae bacterium]|nr:two-component regulator propeller domain-containing protein [Candidatus Manganitrophaceae bacterium]